jgi:integrase
MSDRLPFSREGLQAITAARLEELNDCGALAKMPLAEAGMVWLESRRHILAPRSLVDYEHHIGTLVKYFGNMRLEKLANPDLIRAYQIERSKTCGHAAVNRECSLIQQMLKRIGRWHEIVQFYEPIPNPHESPGRAMTPEEERRLLEVGALNPNWSVAYHLSVLSINTAAGPGELCSLRIEDVRIEDPANARIHFHESAKNKYRIREVPLNADALKATTSLHERAKSLGATEAHHYLIPYRSKRNEYDPSRHGKWPNSAWREMRVAAGVRIRPYDLRHHALAKPAENQPEQVVLKIAGHVSASMLRKVYAHVRLPALRAAVDSISRDANPTVEPSVTKLTRKAPQSAETLPRRAIAKVIAMADRVGVSPEKALQLLTEYEAILNPRKARR